VISEQIVSAVAHLGTRCSAVRTLEMEIVSGLPDFLSTPFAITATKGDFSRFLPPCAHEDRLLGKGTDRSPRSPLIAFAARNREAVQ
jgi:hypothetical protein